MSPSNPPAEPKGIEALEIKFPRQPRLDAQKRRPAPLNPDDPLHFALPTLKELEAQVRRQPIGQTIAEICLDRPKDAIREVLGFLLDNPPLPGAVAEPG